MLKRLEIKGFRKNVKFSEVFFYALTTVLIIEKTESATTGKLFTFLKNRTVVKEIFRVCDYRNDVCDF